jgi:O-antigen/teichoic acid export membrane protein
MSVAPPARSFRSRLAAVFAGELVNKGCVMAAFVYLAHTLSPDAYGDVEWALSIMTVAALAADAGLTSWGTAAIAARPSDAEAIVARVAGVRLALAVPACVVIAAIAFAFGGPAGAALAVYGIVLLLSPLFLQYLFNGLQTRWASFGNAVRGATFLVTTLLVVRAASAPVVVAAAELCGALALVVCNLVLMSSVLRLRPRRLTAAGELRGVLARSWRIGASEVVWGVQWYAGLILLGYSVTSTDVAWHSAALRIVMSLHTGVWLYLYVLLPNLARLLTTDPNGWSRTVSTSLGLTSWLGGLLAVVGTLAAGPIMTLVFGETFAPATPRLQAMIWVLPIAWMSGHWRYSFVAIDPRKDYAAALIGAGTAVALTVLLLPLGGIAAAFGLLGGTAANAVAAWVLSRRALPPVDLRGLATGFGCSAGSLVLGLAATPALGPLAAAGVAGTLLGGIALVVERERARELRDAVLGAVR